HAGEPPPTDQPSPPPPSESPSTSGGGGGAADAEISASGAQFSADSLTLPAGAKSTLAFTNNDAGVQHNVAIFSDSGYSTAVFTGEFVTGPAEKTYDIPTLDPGTYYFRCDAHPTTMTGTIAVR
ncbi:MAG: cupredoxin domain-containing protein, partial [Actinomycetota bacterium]